MAPTTNSSVFSSSLFNSSSISVSRPTTRDSTIDPHLAGGHGTGTTAAPKERKTGFTRKSSRRGTWTGAAAASQSQSQSQSSSSAAAAAAGSSAASANNSVVTDASAPPALPEYALSAAAKVVIREKEKFKEKLREREKEKSRERERDRDIRERERDIRRRERESDAALSPTSPQEPSNFVIARLHAAAMGTQLGPHWESHAAVESGLAFHEINEVAKKRVSTLQYLRKAHEGRIHWFNTYLFDRPDYNRMPTFDPRKLGRRATCYFLLGISIPTISDLYSSTALEFLRCLNGLFAEFDTFTALHGDGPPSAASLTRARLPSMFRRPAAKTRRSGSTSASANDIIEESPSTLSSAFGGGNGAAGGAVMNFATAESELLPGEEYAYLLTPSLPFDPDFYETFATLCDALIDCYTRFLALVPTQAEATPGVADLFAKADTKMRKIMVQGIVRDFEEHSRTNVKNEVAGITKVVLSGLV